MNGILLGIIGGLITLIGIIIIFNSDVKHKPKHDKQLKSNFEEEKNLCYNCGR